MTNDISRIPYFGIPQFPPTKQQMREQNRRDGTKYILECLICKKDFDSSDKKHDDERLSVCYCSFQCWGKSIDNVYAESEYRRNHRHDRK